MEDVARSYIRFARHLALNGCYSKAFDLYLSAFEKCPESKGLFEAEFRLVLMRLNEVLIPSSRIEDIFNNFGRALNAFPGNIHLLNDIGKYLYKYGFIKEAWSHFGKALKADSGFVEAEKNLNSVKNFLVERWHFRMLNDKIRNSAYRDAIHEVLIPDSETVLDLGSGTGLLAMYASECSPVAVTAVDSSSSMTKLSETIMEDNDINDIVVVNMTSTDMNYVDVGGKRSLLVTELFDAGLFGEHILQTLTHAWQNLLDSDAKIIPSKAEFFIVGASSESLNNKYQLNGWAKNLLNVSDLSVLMLSYEETYDCEDVHVFKDLTYITEPQSLININFNSHEDIQDKLDSTEPYVVHLTPNKSGEINVMIGWFNLYLTDNVSVTTDPTSERRCNAWQQAVFYDYIPKTVKENQTIDVEFLLDSGKLTLVQNHDNVIKISIETIRFLNDTEYMKKISSIIGLASVYLGQIAEMSQITIVDLCPFPMFGVLMLKRGVQSLMCYAKTRHDKKFLKQVLKANNIPLSKITVLVGDDWSQDIFMNEKFHVIFCNIMEMCGDLDLRLKEIAMNLKNFHLLQGGLFMPSQICLMGQVVQSEWLDINNRISDENVGEYRMARHVNIYQVSQNFCIDFHNLEYTALTEPYCLGAYSNSLRSDIVNVPVVKSGDANAILCWYSIELMKDMGEISTNRKGSFIGGIAFMANPKVPVVAGELVNVLRCIDPDGDFKFVIDLEAT